MASAGTETQPAVAPLPVDVQEDPGAPAAHRPVVVEADDERVGVLRGVGDQVLGLRRPAVGGQRLDPAVVGAGLVVLAPPRLGRHRDGTGNGSRAARP